MHARKLGKDNAPTRAYDVLCAVYPGRISNWELAQRARTVAVSTVVSEINSQLPEGEKVEVKRIDGGFYYGLVRNRAVQMALL